MKVGYVCTNYNNSSYTRSAIASLNASGREGDIVAVVVDNDSRVHDVESLRGLQRDFPNIELVLNGKNVGYFPGLNVGVHLLRSKYPEIAHMIVGNNDLEFPADFFDTFERHCGILDSWAVVAPDLVTPQGIHQNPHVFHSISRMRKLVWDLYALSYASGVLVKHAARISKRLTVREENATGSELYKQPGPIEQGYGACYLIGPMFHRHFRQFCAPTFMMQEEFFLFEQLQLIGQLTYYDPRFVVYHHGHASTDQLPNRRHWQISHDAHVIYKRYLAMKPAEQRRFVSAACGLISGDGSPEVGIRDVNAPTR
jgi:GT2 family glycosyltransferase